MKKLLNRIRFEFLRLFNPLYIEHQIEKREGDCKRCGICCSGCRHLLYNGCINYQERLGLNPLCRAFPIDKLDKEIVNKNCGYYWKK